MAASTKPTKGSKKPTKTNPVLASLRQNLGQISGCFIVVVALAAQALKLPILLKMTTLSYAQPPSDTGEILYEAGRDDFYFVMYWVFVLTFVRSLAIRFVFRPTAVALGVSTKGEFSNADKFGEMGWQFLYYASAWTTGFTLMNGSWEWWDLDQLFIGYPFRFLSLPFKLYYLIQASFWLHMIVVTLVEKWRKDFAEMMLHHFMTTGLILSSYLMNWTRVGTIILVEQDFADILLPLAKMAKYAKKNTLADVLFASFALAWIPTRHVLYNIIWYAVVTRVNPILGHLSWDPAQGVYMSPWIVPVYGTVLALFQCLLCFWLFLLLRAIKRALTSSESVEDDRSSDDEDSHTD